jgi:hypothetical protein
MEFTRSEGVTAQEFPIVELRRYAMKPGERERFALTFDSYFPEVFQQLGGIVFGQGLERANDTWFTWLRGFPTYDARAEGLWAMYTGPLWKEHAARMNDRMVDAGNVLLLRPLAPGRGLSVLPSVDVVAERARGIVVLQVFAVQPGKVDALASRAEDFFATYRAKGAREAGVLVTLDRPNNFPRHAVRDDGPFLVWLGLVEDEHALSEVTLLAQRAAGSLASSALLRGETELVVLDPTSRSRLRWR